MYFIVCIYSLLAREPIRLETKDIDRSSEWVRHSLLAREPIRLETLRINHHVHTFGLPVSLLAREPIRLETPLV